MSTEQSDPLVRFGEIRRALESRWPESRISPTLDRIRTLTQYLGDPQRAYPVIHITGTNGKTSTARMIESLLRSFGLHTGLLTSPHLSDLRERIRLDGEPIGVERFLEVHDEVAPILAMADEASAMDGGPALSFFEVMVALAYATFADAPVDVAVVEVGMGGTWDATNVADGRVSVVTPIGLDHTDYLGPTIAEIAAEKAGIIKPAAPVVLAAQPPEAAEVLVAAATQLESPMALAGIDFGVAARQVAVGGQLLTLRGLGGDYDEVFLPLFGEHQAGNAATALAAVEAFFGIGPSGAVPALPPQDAAPRRRLDLGMVREGFATVTSPGRLEVVRRAPTVLVDAAHNVHGARALALALADSFAFTHVVAVVGILADKDAAGILSALDPVVDSVVVTRSRSPRALPVADLARIAADVLGDHRVAAVEDLAEALEQAVAIAEAGAPAGVGAGVLVTGSVTVAGEARLLLGAESGGDEGATRSDHAAPRGRSPQDDR